MIFSTQKLTFNNLVVMIASFSVGGINFGFLPNWPPGKWFGRDPIFIQKKSMPYLVGVR